MLAVVTKVDTYLQFSVGKTHHFLLETQWIPERPDSHPLPLHRGILQTYSWYIRSARKENKMLFIFIDLLCKFTFILRHILTILIIIIVIIFCLFKKYTIFGHTRREGTIAHARRQMALESVALTVRSASSFCFVPPITTLSILRDKRNR